ncbi:MAG: SDR family oxidoreductase [Deltaproteobacteria bacterium]|nr:SDR family oxidoreductase [Deltaproteobacteria bacterium]
MAKYLVTGGAGFIGSHIVEELVKKGESVRVLDNLETGKESNIAPFLTKIEFIKGDIRDAEMCKNVCSGVDYVLHQAALGSVPRSIDDPKTTNDVNITGTLNMLIASRDSKTKRFVFASSSSVYGDSPALPKVETMPPNPLSPYALSKYAGETYAILFCKLYGLETVALRYFNVYGPRQDPDSQYAAVIPRFVSTLVSGKRPVIYGDGNQTRDFTYVGSAVLANLLACEASSVACGRTYNIAGGRKVSINDLFYSIRTLVAKERKEAGRIDPVYDPPRPGDVRESLADISQAEKFLKHSGAVEIREGLSRTIDYYFNVSTP